MALGQNQHEQALCPNNSNRRRKEMKHLTASAALLGLVFSIHALSIPASAQEPEDSQAAATEEAFSDEVTVTARKREETLQEVPFSIVAPTEEILRERGVQTLEEISGNIAGFTVQNLGPGQSQVAMRGVSAGQIVRDQPGVKEQVGIYLDESVISLSLFTPDLDLFDLSRVEVLRGPQGTLFGSGSLSGTVRYITNQPEIGVSESYGEFSVETVEDGEFGGSAKVVGNIPLSDTSALRVAAYYTSFGGFIDAVQPDLSVNEDVNSGDRTGIRLALRAEPNERLTITPRIIYQEVDSDGWNRIDDYNILANPFTTTRPAVNLGEREQFTQLEELFTDEFLLADLNIEYDFGNVTLNSITSYTDRDVLVVRDATALTASITGGSIGLPESVFTIDGPLDDATTAEVLTQELRLSGQKDRLDWVVGIFYSTTERNYNQSLLVGGFQAASGIPTQGLRAAQDVLFFSDLEYEFDQLAVFSELTYAVNDRLDLTAGLRWYDFEEDRTQVFDGIFGNGNNGTSLVETAGSTAADGFAPRFIASYKASEDTRLNFQISKGFRLGGINDPLNIPLCTPQDLITFGGRDTWDDEELWNYEVGSKSSWNSGRTTFNIAAFYMDISDLQATVTAGSCSSRVVFNVPDARSSGLEIEFTKQITDYFDIAISASYNDSELQSTLTSTDAAGNVSIVSGIEEGRRLPTVPEFQFFGAATYRWQMKEGWAGYLIGTYQHVGSRFTQIGDQAAGFGTVNLLAFAPNNIGGPLTANTFIFDPELPSYDLVNLRLGFLNEKWDVAIFVKNATDERALLALDQERGTLARVGYLTNQPRTFGVTTRVKF
jgi:iron complex outermembrane receptor protein